jgi:hypothetical protein
MEKFVENLFANPEMLRMGHAQRTEDSNLGLGWIYYALGRILRPRRAVVIGSWRGFVPAVIAKSLVDNSEGGELWFIDPSLADDFWADPEKVATHFSRLGVSNVRHYCHTTQDFIKTAGYQQLESVSLLMIDGYHSAEQARFDYLAFLDKLDDQAIVLFHDSTSRRLSPIYGNDRVYEHTVFQFMDRLKQTPGLEVFTFPQGSGVTLVSGRPASLELIRADF